MKPKIMWVCAMQGRHEVTSLMLKSFQYNKEYWKDDIDMDILMACSTSKDSKFLDDNNIYHVITKNNPVGTKWNTLAKHSLHFDYDYIMITGSDDIYHPDLFDYYLTSIEEGHKYFGLDKVAILEPETRRAKMFNIPIGGKIGVAGPGRMIHRDLVDNFKGSLWPNEDSILDILSNLRLSSVVEPHQVVVKQPLAFDIKTDVNIWGFDAVKGNSKPLSYDDMVDLIPSEYRPKFKQVA